MQRDGLLLAEMMDAAEQIQELVDGVTVEQLATDRQRRDALLWNYTVLGEASVQVSEDLKGQVPRCPLAATISTAESHRAWILVDRLGDPAYNGDGAATQIRGGSASRIG